jgi:hypothetical protein
MGRIGSEQLQELKEQLVGAAMGISFDLDDVSPVNVNDGFGFTISTRRKSATLATRVRSTIQ